MNVEGYIKKNFLIKFIYDIYSITGHFRGFYVLIDCKLGKIVNIFPVRIAHNFNLTDCKQVVYKHECSKVI